MQTEARGFVAKRLSPAHLAVIVFVVTSLLLQSVSAFARSAAGEAGASASFKKMPSTLKEAVDAVVELKKSAPKGTVSKLKWPNQYQWERQNEYDAALKLAEKNANEIAIGIAEKLLAKRSEIEQDAKLNSVEKNNRYLQIDDARTKLARELNRAGLPIPDGVMEPIKAKKPYPRQPDKVSEAEANIKWEAGTPTRFQEALNQARNFADLDPGSKAHLEAQRNVVKIAEEIAQKLTEGQTRIQNDQTLTKEQRENVIRHLEGLRTWMRTEMEIARIPVSGAILLNPKLGASTTNVHQVEVDWLVSKKESLRREVESYKTGYQKFKAGAPGAIKHFGAQYATFGAASFLLSLMQLGYAYQANPVGVEQNFRGLRDPVGAVGFGVFMAANHPVAKLLHGIQNKTIPMSMIPYVAMFAGGLASTMFHDLIEDIDFQACTKTYFTDLKRDEKSCNAALDNWVITNKIVDYTPGLTSLLASQFAADVARNLIINTGKLSAKGLDQVATRLTIKGLVLIPRTAEFTAQAIRLLGYAAAGGSPVVAITIGGVQFFAFLYIDSQIKEPISHLSRDHLMATRNWKTTFQRYGFHRDFYDPPAGAKQMIQNAFDVEGTDLRSANKLLRLNYINLSRNNWRQPEDVNKCVPPEIAGREIPGHLMTKPWLIGNYFDFMAGWGRVYYKKSDDQLRCEVLAQPSTLMNRYAEQNESWRSGHLLKSFKDKQQNWYQLIGVFNDEFQAARKLMEFFANAKFAAAKDPSKKPDLSIAGLTKALAADGEGGEAHVQLPAEALKPTAIMDQTIRALACGAKLNPLNVGIMKVVDWWKGEKNSPFIPTKFGSSLNFLAPNITTGNGSICENGEVAKNLAYTPMHERPIADDDTFTGRFQDPATDKVYTGLVEYIYDNLADDVWKSEGSYSNFSTYWTENIQAEVEKVWKSYTDSYMKLVAQEFMPVAFNREFRNGCPEFGSNTELHDEDGFIKQSTEAPNKPESLRLCQDNHMAYRVGSGAFLSLEIELRNYLRGLHMMNAALYNDKAALAAMHKEKSALTAIYADKGALAVSQAQIVKNANDIISEIATLTKDDLMTKDLEEWSDGLRAKLQEIKKLIESRLDVMNEPKEKSFRRGNLDQLTTFASGLITEAANMGAEVKVMDFANANARPTNKDVYKKKGGNPFNRGAQH